METKIYQSDTLLPRSEFVYKTFKMRLSNKEMSLVMYWIVMCKASLSQTFGIGIYKYERQTNCHNYVDCMLHIHPRMIEQFTKETGMCLKEPAKIELR